MKRVRIGKTAAYCQALALMLTGLSFFPAQVRAQEAGITKAVAFRPGILLHPTLDVAYVMTPGGISALDIATGKTQWTSDAAGRPLTLAGNLLISLVEPAARRNRLELVALDIQKDGKTVVRSVTDLPADVKVSVGDTPEGTFTIEAYPSNDSAIIDWTFWPIPRRGLRDDPDEEEEKKPTDATPNRLLARPSVMNGTFRMSLRTGAVTQQDNTKLSLPPQQRKLVLSRISDREERYESMDGRHVVKSEWGGDYRVWDQYVWTVYERSTDRRLGAFRSHNSFNPFVVRDSLVILETTPFTRIGAPKEPAKLRAISLGNGQEVWSMEVREIIYRGSFPP